MASLFFGLCCHLETSKTELKVKTAWNSEKNCPWRAWVGGSRFTDQKFEKKATFLKGYFFKWQPLVNKAAAFCKSRPPFKKAAASNKSN